MLQRRIQENIALLAGELYSCRSYVKWYEKNCEELDGTPGIIDFIIKAAEIFSKDEPEDIDWIISIENFAQLILEAPGLCVADADDLKKMARRAYRHEITGRPIYEDQPIVPPTQELTSSADSNVPTGG